VGLVVKNGSNIFAAISAGKHTLRPGADAHHLDVVAFQKIQGRPAALGCKHFKLLPAQDFFGGGKKALLVIHHHQFYFLQTLLPRHFH
jgi:hypothetical protein